MNYRLVVTKRAEELLDNVLNYIINQLKNAKAADSLMKSIRHVYNNLKENSKIYAYSNDMLLKAKGYRKAVVLNYNYVIIFRIEEELKIVYIVGFFHGLESYSNKISFL